MVGFDYPPDFLKTAQKLARKEGILSSSKLRLYQGDAKFIEQVLRKNHEGQFDAIMWKAGGMLRASRKEELDLLRSMLRLTRAGGVLALDMYSREWLEIFLFFGSSRSNSII
ncbi:MAG: class I SAM-dependent methyltransferase [Nitrososphaerales archaeon]